MQLSAMFARINQKTGFIFTPDEVYAAINESGQYVYQKVLKENRGFFIKVDETSLILNPGTPGQDQVYDLPSDCTQILHLAERPSNDPTCRWEPMEPTSIGKAFSDEWQSYVDYDGFGAGSRFKYAGPFLPASNVSGALIDYPQIQQIAVTPTVDQARTTQLIYAAKWLEIVDSTSANMLPDEGTTTQYNGAMAILTGDMDDTRTGSYAQRAKLNLDAFLQWCADRQLQRGMRVKSYLL
jgi:hypothetical protein